MNNKEYLGDLIGGSLMIADCRIIAETLLKNLPEDEWKKLVIEENILQKKSVNTASRNAYTLRKRLEPLGRKFLQTLLDVPEQAYIQLLLMAFLIHSPVVVDFMQKSLAEAKRTYKPGITPDAWAEFIEDRIRAYPELGKYSESTLKKMGNNVVKALVDSGYLNSSRQRQIQAVYLLPEVKACLSDLGHEDLINIMECTA
jgi:hypothetical protein